MRVLVTLALVATGIVTIGQPVSAAPKVTVLDSALPADVGHYAPLRGVSCVTPSDCVAVGTYTQQLTGLDRTFVEHWDGLSWSLMASADTDEPYNHLTAVDCVSPTSCVAVGNSSPYPDDDYEQPVNTLIEHWNGTAWTIVPTPRPSSDPSSYRSLNSVSCVTSTDCFAVGGSGIAGPTKTLTLRWNGTAWKVVPSPNADARYNASALSGVSCLTHTNCWAVGRGHVENEHGTINQDNTLIEHWDGKSWKIFASPNPTKTSAPLGNYLQGVSCVAKHNCTATGYYGKYRDTTSGRVKAVPLVERWNGTAWKVAPSVAPSNAAGNRLSAVSCASKTSCLAVGSDYSATSQQLLMEHWNGTKWSIVTAPKYPGPLEISLDAVSCVQTTCIAVGQRYKYHSSLQQPLIVRYS